MDQIADERFEKYDRIVEKYEERKTQQEVADMYGMNKRHVAKVTQLDNCHNTRKVKKRRSYDSYNFCISIVFFRQIPY